MSADTALPTEEPTAEVAAPPAPPVRLEPFGRAVVVIALLLVVLGLVMVYSASGTRASTLWGDGTLFLRRQVTWAAIGVVAIWATMRVNPFTLGRLGRWMLLGTIVLLGLVLIPGVGTEINGARRWFRIGGASFQPSELAKLSLVIALSWHLAERKSELGDWKRGVLPAIAALGAVVLLTLPEPDFGTALFLGAIGGSLLLVGGLPVTSLAAFGLVASPFLIMQVRDRWEVMVKRFSVLGGVGPDGSPVEQVQHALVALGSGGLTGVGLGAGRQKLFFLPEAQTDFILPVVGEELGFLGTASVVILFALFVACGARIVLGAAQRDRYLFLLGFGLVLLVGLQAAGNIAVVTGSVPTKGIALPFVSLGGSSLVTLCVAVGLLHAIAARADAIAVPAVPPEPTTSEDTADATAGPVVPSVLRGGLS